MHGYIDFKRMGVLHHRSRKKKKIKHCSLYSLLCLRSVPRRIIQLALEFFYIPQIDRDCLGKNFNQFILRLSTVKYTTMYVVLHRGIGMVCAISPVLFLMVIEVTLRGLKSECRFLQNEVKTRIFMDDKSN